METLQIGFGMASPALLWPLSIGHCALLPNLLSAEPISTQHCQKISQVLLGTCRNVGTHVSPRIFLALSWLPGACSIRPYAMQWGLERPAWLTVQHPLYAWATGPLGNAPKATAFRVLAHCFATCIVLLPGAVQFFFLNMLNNWKMLYDCYWLVPVNSLKSSQQNSQIKASFFCLETWVSLFIAAQPRDRMVMWSEPTCICPEPDAQQGYAQDDLQTYHSE